MRGPRIALVLLALAAAGCSREPAAPARAPVPVRVEAATLSGASGALRYSGSVVPWAQVDVATKVNGYIVEIRQVRSADGRMRDLAPGDAVKRGTVLARVGDADYVDKVRKAKADLDKSNASLEKAQQDWKRAQDLYASASITAPDHDQARREIETARAAVDGSKAQLDESRTNLGYTVVTAPMDGVVVKRKVELGSLVGPGSVAFTLADVRLVKVSFGVPDTMLKHVDLGTPLDIVTESLPGRTFTGKVTTVAPAADTKTRTFGIEVTIDNARGELRDGMVAALQVPAGMALPQAPTVPLAAIVAGRSAGTFAAFVVTDEGGRTRATLRPLELGAVIGNRVIVTGGLKAGERVVVNGVNTVHDGDDVRISP
jgi:multidrug efflux system membrane fusion protein